MFIWRTWFTKIYEYGVHTKTKVYKVLLLFGIIPIYIAIDG